MAEQADSPGGQDPSWQPVAPTISEPGNPSATVSAPDYQASVAGGLNVVIGLVSPVVSGAD